MRRPARGIATRGLLALLGLLAGALAGGADLQQPRAASLRSLDPLPEPALAARLLGADTTPLADRVVVRKGERRLYLMRGSTVLRSYHVALGLNPIGQKERSGDFRTPEGSYFLTRRNPRSDYFLSIQVSYPNDLDLRRARHHRWAAGGAIMLHGLPNQLRLAPDYYEQNDWTDGCIALSNSDMLEIWLMTQDRTPIQILP